MQSEFCTWQNSITGQNPRKCIYGVPAQETVKHRAKFGWLPLSDVTAVTKPRRETRWHIRSQRISRAGSIVFNGTNSTAGSDFLHHKTVHSALFANHLLTNLASLAWKQNLWRADLRLEKCNGGETRNIVVSRTKLQTSDGSYFGCKFVASVTATKAISCRTTEHTVCRYSCTQQRNFTFLSGRHYCLRSLNNSSSWIVWQRQRERRCQLSVFHRVKKYIWSHIGRTRQPL